ncbi:MAG TPA: PIN domain-containing protein [Polyangia bacterium]|nr:PIN domain-containing protein [Polyangia bacterium]
MFVDSGAWLALFSARDDNHSAAEVLFRRAAGHRVPLITTNLVLAEVHRLLLFRAGPAVASAALARVDDSDLVSVTFASQTHHQAARAWLAKLSDQKITYADAISFAVMDAERCRVAMSFDRDFWLAGYELWQ